MTFARLAFVYDIGIAIKEIDTIYKYREESDSSELFINLQNRFLYVDARGSYTRMRDLLVIDLPVIGFNRSSKTDSVRGLKLSN